MKKKERTALAEMSREQLSKQKRDVETALADFMAHRYTKQSKNVREGRALRRKLAYILTLIRTEELAHEKSN